MSYFHHFHHLVTTHLYAPTLELWFKFELHVDRRLEPVVQCSKQSWKSFSSHVTVSLPVGNELQSQISKLAAPKCSWVTDTWENLCSLVALGSVLRWMMDPSMDILHHNFKTKPQKHPYVNLIIIFLLPDSQPDGAAALVHHFSLSSNCIFMLGVSPQFTSSVSVSDFIHSEWSCLTRLCPNCWQNCLPGSTSAVKMPLSKAVTPHALQRSQLMSWINKAKSMWSFPAESWDWSSFFLRTVWLPVTADSGDQAKSSVLHTHFTSLLTPLIKLCATAANLLCI